MIIAFFNCIRSSKCTKAARPLLVAVLLFSYSTFFSAVQAQPHQWTWMKGDSSVFEIPVYGSQGIPSPTVTPGAAGGGPSWRDTSGNFWFLVGGVLNHLWKYNITTGEWAWMKGSFTSSYGVYGTKGVANVANTPGERSGAIGWTDAAGNLWLFGGHGKAASGVDGDLNDLWKYDISNGNWTWINGDNTVNHYGVYGTKGVSNAANKPGCRLNSFSWKDNAGNFWLYGGFGHAASLYGTLDDLWKYDVSTGEWTWVAGSNTRNQQSVYGTQGVANATNKPGGRSNGASWCDAAGNLWLFGGYGYSASPTNGGLNDLWKYDVSSGLWTWVKGSNTTGAPGTYGTKGVASASNTPGVRHNSAGWTDLSGNFWLFGGFGVPPNATTPAFLNDLWKYEVSTSNWTWMTGSNLQNQFGIYGTPGVASPTNTPGTRMSSMAWSDVVGNLWLFGGDGVAATQQGPLSDLWSTCTIAPPQPGAISGNNAPCSGSSQTYNVPFIPGSVTYLWTLPSGWTGTSTTNSITVNAGTASGNITVTAVNSCGSSPAQTIAVSSSPGNTASIAAAGPATFCQGGSVALNANTGAGFTYQWQLNNVDIPGATTASYTAANSGSYTVVVSLGSCSVVSAPAVVTVHTFLAQPGAISGNATMCTGFSGSYSVPSNPNAAAYQWTLPAGWTGTSTTNSINLTPGALGGTITVVATNSCGTSPSQSFAVAAVPAPPAVITASGPATFCQGDSVLLNANTGTGFTYQWQSNNADIPGATSSGYYASTAAAYTVAVSNSACSVTSLATNVVVNPLPVPSITQSGNLLTAQPGFTSYQWYWNNTLIPGATASSHPATQSGSYEVVVTDANGCTGRSNMVAITVGINDIRNYGTVSVYPNPARGRFTVHIDNPLLAEDARFSISDIVGKQIMTGSFTRSANGFVKNFVIENLSAGSYILQISIGEITSVHKVLVAP